MLSSYWFALNELRSRRALLQLFLSSDQILIFQRGNSLEISNLPPLSVMVIVSSCQSSHARLPHRLWQLRNVITAHNEEWNQLYHHHASKIELAPLKVSLKGFLHVFLDENTRFLRCEPMMCFMITGKQNWAPPPTVKDIWRSLNNQSRSVTRTAYGCQSGRSDLTKVTDQTLKLKWGVEGSQ